MDNNIPPSVQETSDAVHDIPRDDHISLDDQVGALLKYPQVIKLVQVYWSSDELSAPWFQDGIIKLVGENPEWGITIPDAEPDRIAFFARLATRLSVEPVGPVYSIKSTHHPLRPWAMTLASGVGFIKNKEHQNLPVYFLYDIHNIRALHHEDEEAIAQKLPDLIDEYCTKDLWSDELRGRIIVPTAFRVKVRYFEGATSPTITVWVPDSDRPSDWGLYQHILLPDFVLHHELDTSTHRIKPHTLRLVPKTLD